jgi:hypothetical protein
MSPEILFEMPWNTATDIWSFGTLARYNLTTTRTQTDISTAHQPHLRRRLQPLPAQRTETRRREVRAWDCHGALEFFGPFPAKYAEIADPETVQCILWIMEQIPREKMTEFSRMTLREVSKRDNVFISKMMKLDWRDRPTAAELLGDEWWDDDDVE